MAKPIYLICRQCDDSYYEWHPMGDAYTTREAAEAALAEVNGPDDGSPDYPWYYTKTIDLHD